MRRRIFLSSAILIAFTYVSSSAWAITAQDVMDKMGKDERWGYLTGLVDMMSYQALLNGDKARARCVVDWFYEDEATTKKVFTTLLHFPDKAPESILILMAKKACGASEAAAIQETE